MLTETLYSRILGTAREQGLVYHMSSGYGQTKLTSNWWFGAQVMPANAPALFNIIVRELKNVRRGRLKEEDIAAAKQYLIGRYQRSGQTVGGTMAGYSPRYFFDGQVDDYYKVPARIKAVTKERVLSVTEAMFSDKVHGLGLLGNIDDATKTGLEQQIQVLWQQ